MSSKVQSLKAENWKSIVHDCLLAKQETGITKAAWCRENGVNPKTFYRWQRIFCSEIADQVLPSTAEIIPARPEIIPVQIAQPDPAPSSTANEILLEKAGLTIHLPVSVSADYLTAAIRGIQSC